ncbi:MAG TPA: ROK family protein [Actinomycetes bacterium]|jgi:glucokinase|nr:ROK family protein [Actinomycetes bacterium]
MRVEVGGQPPGRGTGAVCLGVDIGGTKTRVGLVAADHRVLDVREAPTPARDGARAVLEVAAGLAGELRSRPGQVAACGVGTAGVVDAASGTVVAATAALRGWAGTPVARELAARLGLPTYVDNDVNAFALGEAAAGAAAGGAHLLAVTVGTGIGGAFLLDGRVWRGARHHAGEIGHLPLPGLGDRLCPCGASGHLESVAAGPAMAARYRALVGVGSPGPRAGASPDVGQARGSRGEATAPAGASGQALAFVDVAARAERGDALAAEVIDEGGGVLGLVLAGLVNALDVESVVAGGGVAQPGGRYWAAAERRYHRHLLPAVAGVPLLPARLGRDAVLVGAAELARRATTEPAP